MNVVFQKRNAIMKVGPFDESSEIGWLAGMSDMSLFSCYVLCISIPGVASAVFRPGQALTPTFDPTRTRLSRLLVCLNTRHQCSLCVYFFPPVVFSHLCMHCIYTGLVCAGDVCFIGYDMSL
ncbi:hypothetical protein BDV40DRAFT_276924 [Aspergillus tamarii]|uniref:Uncharacterized protein n=1 Tax=Aspergillus tamarii TaxID=41984 RepID=A0A5N6UHN3_ASPTM|nr:hypothetical protein BDV40DRAFT_276924 [Aspergillus tamarii]